MAKKKKREFEVVGVVPGNIYFKGSFYDLATLTEAQASVLIEQGCDYLKWKSDPEAPE